MTIKVYPYFFFGILLLIAPGVSSAARLLFEPPRMSAHTGEFIKMDLAVTPGDERINAVEGKVLFPNDILAVADITYGNSVLSFWPEAPHVQEPGIISFSGVAPGGYGPAGNALLFSIVFKATKEGEAGLTLADSLVLKDDGQGTAAELTLNRGTIVIAGQTAMTQADVLGVLGALDPLRTRERDREAPETFVPLVATSQGVFNGKYFLAFATTDKQSGIDHYEIQESKMSFPDEARWFRAESPYELSDQALQSFIFVKAVDKAGNARLAIVPPEHARAFSWVPLALVLIVVVLGTFAIVMARRKRRKNVNVHGG